MEAVLVGEPDSPVPTRSRRIWRRREVRRPVANTGPWTPRQVPGERRGRLRVRPAPRPRLAKRGLVLFFANRLVFIFVPVFIPT